MAQAEDRRVHISPWASIPLSILMILASIMTFTGTPSGDGPDWPVFTSFRQPGTLLQIYNARRLDTPPWLFNGAKGMASICWCILMPLQHNLKIRRTWPALHRSVGYLAIFLSVELGIAGYYMLLNGMATSHKNIFHIHSLGPIPFIIWPTFTATTLFLSVLYFVALFRLYVAIRTKDIEAHRRWAVLHTILGYTIALSRFFAFVVVGVGWLLVLISEDFKRKWLKLPVSTDDVVAAEVSALAWTLASASIVSALWAYREWSQAGLLCVWAKSPTVRVNKNK